MWHLSALKFALCFSLAALSVWGQDYFPLETGNVWVYKAGGTRRGTPLVLEVLRSEQISGRTYYLLSWPPKGEFWLRSTDDGTVLQYDPQTREEKVWYRFQAPLKEHYQTALPACCGMARIESRNAPYKGLVGEHPALEVTYPGVFQVGIDRELFIPYVGMVFRHENTGGPTIATYDLSYARLGGVTIVAERGIATALSLDRRVYAPDAQIRARFSVSNTHDTPVVLNFSSGQLYNLAIRNASGTVVYNWMADKLFPAVAQRVTLGRREFFIDAPLPNLAPGKYTAEAWLVTTDYPEKAFLASTGFEVARQ